MAGIEEKVRFGGGSITLNGCDVVKTFPIDEPRAWPKQVKPIMQIYEFQTLQAKMTGIRSNLQTRPLRLLQSTNAPIEISQVVKKVNRKIALGSTLSAIEYRGLLIPSPVQRRKIYQRDEGTDSFLLLSYTIQIQFIQVLLNFEQPYLVLLLFEIKQWTHC